MHLCMATRTISIDEEAYDRLARAKLDRKDSFSKVIKRATWEKDEPRCGDLLRRMTHLPPLGEKVLEQLEQTQLEDHPPDNPWNR